MFVSDWQRSSQDSTQAAKVALRLLDPRGFEVSAVNVPLTDLNGQPLVKWPTDQTALDYYVLPLPPGTPPLTYTLSARVYDTGRESVEQVLDTLKLSRRLDTSDPYHTLIGYRWQTIPLTTMVTGLRLEVFSISPQKPKPLDQVDITLRWRKTASSDQAIPRVQLVQDNRVWLDLGSDLFERNYPVDQWQTGEMVIEHRPVQFVTVPILVIRVLPAGVQDAEVAAEIPQSITNIVAGQDIEHILEPGEEDLVRGFVPASALTAVDANAAFG